MNDVRLEIARLEAAVALYDGVIPHSAGAQLAQLRRHRALDLQIIADLSRFTRV